MARNRWIAQLMPASPHRRLHIHYVLLARVLPALATINRVTATGQRPLNVCVLVPLPAYADRDRERCGLGTGVVA